MGSKKTIFILLAVIWGALLLYYLGGFGGGAPERSGGVRSGAGVVLLSNAIKDIPELRLDLLARERSGFKKVKKDIFGPLAVKVVIVKEEEEEVETVVVKDPVPPPPRQDTPLEVFIKNTDFMGFVEKAKVKTVFLTKGDDVYYVKAGEMLENRFYVTRITEWDLKLKDVETNEEATIIIAERSQ